MSQNYIFYTRIFADEENSTQLLANERYFMFFKSFSQHRMHNIFYPTELILSYYTMFLIILGTICNAISFMVMNARKLRNYSCMKILSFLSIVDTLVLYQWNLNTFFKYNLSSPPHFEDLEEISIVWCRLISFLAFSTLQISSWLLALVSFDRAMGVYSTCWTRQMNKSKKLYTLIIFICVFVLLLNSHLLVFNGFYVEKINPETSQSYKAIICYQSKWDEDYIFPKWQTVHLFMYNAIPFLIMLVCNFFIIYNVKYARKVKSHNKKSEKRKKRMTFMLILVTCTFMILTLPSVIVHTFYREILSDKPYRRMINLIVNNLVHTSHAINFFLYIFSAPNFRTEFNQFFADLMSKFRKSESQNLRSQLVEQTDSNKRKSFASTIILTKSDQNNKNNQNNAKSLFI
ncbi:FMRFamide receptor-like [Brachionus plicatilis]|uniref:FMRFamide receptor-like n=1 Tax=Brachionus plicatilis TaxID=10195 RepID=A0A3M7R9E3_BRAPC|nr:FMRFamide receptor-like [Brachionus plicatilis]